MDETFQVGRPSVVAHHLAVECELHDVGLNHQLGAARTRQQEVLWVRRVANADMAIAIDDVLVREDAVADHQVAQCLVEIAHFSPPDRIHSGPVPAGEAPASLPQNHLASAAAKQDRLPEQREARQGGPSLPAVLVPIIRHSREPIAL